MDDSHLEMLQRKWKGLLKKGRKISFNKGHFLFYEDHHPYGVYVIHTGRVRFIGKKKSCLAEHIHEMPEGRLIGLDHILKEIVHCCSCIAETDCEVTFISKAHMSDLSASA